jgi:hypothetical protein
MDKSTTGDTKMLTKTKIALAAALVLGTASAVLANDADQSPSTAQSTREWNEYLGQSQNGGSAYGYVVAPKQTHRAPHVRSQDR